MGCCESSEETATQKQQHRRKNTTHGERDNLVRQDSAAGGGGGGRKVGGGGGRALGGPAASGDAKTMAAEAMMRRQESNIPGMSREASNDLRGTGANERMRKDALVADIRALYDKIGEDAPIGLPASTEEQLKVHKRHLEERVKNKKRSA